MFEALCLPQSSKGAKPVTLWRLMSLAVAGATLACGWRNMWLVILRLVLKPPSLASSFLVPLTLAADFFLLLKVASLRRLSLSPHHP